MNMSCITSLKNFSFQSKGYRVLVIIILLIICAMLSAFYNLSQHGLTRPNGTIKFPINIDSITSANLTTQVHRFPGTNFKAAKSNQTLENITLMTHESRAEIISRMMEKKELPKNLIIKKLKKDWGVDIDAKSLDVFLGIK